jgi:hypothetical protein
MKEDAFVNGFIHLILDAYKYYLKHGKPKVDVLAKDAWTMGYRKENKFE